MQPSAGNKGVLVSRMKIKGIKRRFSLFCINHFLSGTHFFEIKRKLLIFAGFEIGEGTKVVGPLFCTGMLTTGKDCWIGRDISVNGNGTVEIGDCCDVAPGVMFLTGGHEIGNEARRAGAGERYTIRVGNGTWLGARTTLLGNIRIGTGCVVAACACVTSDVADHSLVGGVPARLIRELDHETQ